MQNLWKVCLFLLATLPAQTIWAQYTTVTASNLNICGAPLSHVPYNASLIIPTDATTQPTFSGTTTIVPQLIVSGQLTDGFGNLSITLADNNQITTGSVTTTQWKFFLGTTMATAISASGAPYVTTTLTITGATQDISVALQALLNALQPCAPGGATQHNLLSATHPDTIPYSPPQIGDLIRGSINQLWERFAVGQVGQVLTAVTAGGGVLPQWAWPDTLDTCGSVQVSGVEAGCEHEINFIPGTNITSITAVDNSANGSIDVTINSSGGGTGSKTLNIDFDQCSPSITTNPGAAFWTISALSNFDFGHWEYTLGGQGVIWCTVRVPSNMNATPAAKVLIDLSNNGTNTSISGTFQVCDVITSALQINVGAPACATAQTFTQQSVAYKQVELSFDVQSTLTANQYLVVKILKADANVFDGNILMQPPKLQLVEDF